MFKMGCSMARKILAIDGKGSSSSSATAGSGAGGEHSTPGSSKKNKDKQSGGGGSGGAKQAVSADELGDFSKLEQDPRIPLNVRQIFKITKSWKAIARTMSKTGTAMFLNLFEQNQDLFYLFDRFQHLKGEDLHESMELREHAATVMSTLDQSISSLSDYDNFVTYLHSIGKLHRKVPGFKREHFWKIEQPFLKAVKQTLDERCNETIEEIYKIAIKLIIETIADGYGDDDNNNDATAIKADDDQRRREPGGGDNDYQGQTGGGRSNGDGNGGGGKQQTLSSAKGANTNTMALKGNSRAAGCSAASSAASCALGGGLKLELLAKDSDNNEAVGFVAVAIAADADAEASETSGPNHCCKDNISNANSLQSEVCSTNLMTSSGGGDDDDDCRGMRATREPQNNINRIAELRLSPETALLELKEDEEDTTTATLDRHEIILASSGLNAVVEPQMTQPSSRNVAADRRTISKAINGKCGLSAKEKYNQDGGTNRDASANGTLFALSRLLPALVSAMARAEQVQCPADSCNESAPQATPLDIERAREQQNQIGDAGLARDSSRGDAWEAAASMAATTTATSDHETGSGSLINCSQSDSCGANKEKRKKKSTKELEGGIGDDIDSQAQVMRDERRRNLDRADKRITNNCSSANREQHRVADSDNNESPSSDGNSDKILTKTQRATDNSDFPNKTSAHSTEAHRLVAPTGGCPWSAGRIHAASPTSQMRFARSSSSGVFGKLCRSIKKSVRKDKSGTSSNINNNIDKSDCSRFDVAGRQSGYDAMHKKKVELSLSSDPRDLIELIKVLMLNINASSRSTHLDTV